MNSTPLISVCIPAYNGAEFIAHTIQSVLNQSFVDFELIVSDDRSSDDTVSIIKAFSDRRIKLIENAENLGLGGNWNRVLSLGLGKYVKLLCEDDLLHPQCLERQLQVLEHPVNKGVVLTLCARNVINERSQVILKPRRPRITGVVKGSKLITGSIRAGTNLIGEPAVGLFRREAMRKNEMCDPDNAFLSDLGLWSELLKWGDAFVDPACLASFRVSRGATSSIIGLGQPASFRKFALKQRCEGFYQISNFDLLSGCVLSLGLCFLRNALVRIGSRRYVSTHQGNNPATIHTCAPVPPSEVEHPCHVSRECQSDHKQSCAICN